MVTELCKASLSAFHRPEDELLNTVKTIFQIRKQGQVLCHPRSSQNLIHRARALPCFAGSSKRVNQCGFPQTRRQLHQGPSYLPEILDATFRFKSLVYNHYFLYIRKQTFAFIIFRFLSSKRLDIQTGVLEMEQLLDLKKQNLHLMNPPARCKLG